MKIILNFNPFVGLNYCIYEYIIMFVSHSRWNVITILVHNIYYSYYNYLIVYNMFDNNIWFR